MLRFTCHTNKEQYQADLHLFQSIYQQKIKKTWSMRVYLGLLLIFIATLVYFGVSIRDRFFNDTAIFLSMLVIGAYVPINWYLTLQINHLFNDLIAVDTAEVFTKRELVFDDAGITVNSDNSTYRVSWEGVGRMYLISGCLIIYCESNHLIIPLTICEPIQDSSTMVQDIAILSGKKIEELQGPHTQVKDNGKLQN